MLNICRKLNKLKIMPLKTKYLLMDIVRKDFVFKISPHTHLERNYLFRPISNSVFN